MELDRSAMTMEPSLCLSNALEALLLVSGSDIDCASLSGQIDGCLQADARCSTARFVRLSYIYLSGVC